MHFTEERHMLNMDLQRARQDVGILVSQAHAQVRPDVADVLMWANGLLDLAERVIGIMEELRQVHLSDTTDHVDEAIRRHRRVVRDLTRLAEERTAQLKHFEQKNELKPVDSLLRAKDDVQEGGL